MRKVICTVIAAGIVFSAIAAPKKPKKIYQLPEEASKERVVTSEKVETVSNFSLAGSESGLYKIFENKVAVPLKTGVSFSKIIKVTKTEVPDAGPNGEVEQYYFSTSQGIMTSTDLENFEFRNSGLPFLTIKKYKDGETSFEKQPAQIKDFAVHPENPAIMVTATKDNVFITYDGALNWESIGSASKTTAGLKAVAVCTVPKVVNGVETGEKELVVFMSHPIFGFSYYLPERAKPVWNDCNSGFEMMKTMSSPDEISDILCVSVTDNATGEAKTEIFVSQSFLPRIYRFDWKEKKANLIYSGEEPAETIDGLYWNGKQIVFARTGGLEALNLDATENSETVKNAELIAENNIEEIESNIMHTKSQSETPVTTIPTQYIQWKDAFFALAPKDTLYCAYLNGFDGTELSLSELWLLKPEVSGNKYYDKASKIKAVYIPANRVCTQEGIDNFKKLVRNNKLNAVVIDMKDDYGLLRYNTKDPLVMEKGFVSRYSIDLENFVRQMKEENVYLIARIVSFKDKNLSQYAGGKYAIWDKTTNRAWVGTKGYDEIKDPTTGEVTGKKLSYYDENWCDPYSPEVWEYNVAIAKELVSRGFDEIQYDYIRFPTDGLNMRNAQYRWHSPGMDKESALISFLKYARENIDAPIGIDIYGANGWYRSGTRTGQDVELLAQYVDVICPMFYPSHFEQSFLNFAPHSERPYRIYFYGSYRNTVIGRNRIIVRPWVQAFYIGVSYDRQYYDKNYVLREIYGSRDGTDTGYMYWNNIGRYDDVSPDVGVSPYPWSADEASVEFRKPAFSGGEKHPEKTPAERNDVQTISELAEVDFSLSNVKVVKKETKPQSNEAAQAETKIETKIQNKKSSWPSVKSIQELWKNFAQ